jgi:membrane protease YdiL (CAAX protease family)
MDPTYIILLLGPVLLAVLFWRGCFRRDALDAGPSRGVGLVPADLLIGLGLMIMGPSLVVLATSQGGTGEPSATGTLEPDTVAVAGNILMGQVAGQLIPVLYLLWRVSSGPRGLKGLGLIGAIPQKPLRDLAWGALGLIVAVTLVMATIQAAVFLGEWFGQQAPELAHPLLKVLVDSDSLLGSAMIIISAVLVAPILEEAIFRGLIQSVMGEVLGDGRRWSIVLVASFVFTMIHAGSVNWQALPGLFVLALVLGWLYERSGSLWPGIFVHIGFNALNIAAALSISSAAA